MEKLHTIVVFYNFCEYQCRYKLAKEFIERYKNHNKMILYVVELAYGNQQFAVTSSENQNHLQLRTDNPLWHKENLINIGIEKLLPKKWKYVAWIDCNLKFENKDFVEKTIDVLQKFDVVQMYKIIKYDTYQKYSYIYYKNPFGDRKVISIKEKMTALKGDFAPGGALACTRKAYNTMGKLFDLSLVGGGDSIFAYALTNINFVKKYEKYGKNKYYIKMIDEYIARIKNLTFSYVDNELKYYSHGDIKKRQYHTRDVVLADLNPVTDITITEQGIIQLKNRDDLQQKINKLFFDRDEDDKNNS